MSPWFGLLELPFLFVCVLFSFRTASALKGGMFGKGMKLLAWGFLIMAFGHIHMLLAQQLEIDLFEWIFPSPLDKIFWHIALVATWFLSAMGFFRMYQASKS